LLRRRDFLMSSVVRIGDHWKDRAACRSPEVTVLFYPPYSTENKADRLVRESYAKAICKGCPVIDECLNYAMDIDEPLGIWGGKTEIERRKLKLTQATI
jgi:WhiB family redox-sensing transcriptional regulator